MNRLSPKQVWLSEVSSSCAQLSRLSSSVSSGLTTLVITPEIVTAEIDKVGVSEVVTHESDNVSTMAATPGVKGETSVQSKYKSISQFMIFILKLKSSH